MVLALGLGGPDVAIFHLSTHAFFKALLFLGAGAMIHALHTQDIWHMGGLLKQMPVTAVTFLVGTLALCGIPPLSGFFSKDEILALAFEKNRFLFWLALFTAALTAFYMARAVWIAVLGPKRGTHHNHAHEAPAVMKWPLIVLSVFSVIGGFIGIPAFILGPGAYEHHGLNVFVAACSIGAALAGLALGTALYARLRTQKDPLVAMLGAAYGFIVKKYYLDEFFLGVAAFFQRTIAGVFFRFDSRIIIERGVNGVAAVTTGFASWLRRSQTGLVQTYAMVFGFGIVALIYFMLNG